MTRVAAAFILRDDRILICQRTRHQPHPLKWEFPGGKIEAGEQTVDALRRELHEELGIVAQIGDEVRRIQHTYPQGATVELRFFMVERYEGEIVNQIFKDIRWVSRQELPGYDFLEADAGLVQEIAAGNIF